MSMVERSCRNPQQKSEKNEFNNTLKGSFTMRKCYSFLGKGDLAFEKPIN
jgi:hypothetical protein